jgi:heptosyltransferase II
MKRILVRSPNWIGDQILAYPFFFFLRRAFPQSRIDVVCASWVESVQYRDLIDDVHLMEKPRERGLWAGFQAVEATAGRLKKAGPWDLAITLPSSFSSAWMLFRAGSASRRGFRGDGRSWLLTEAVRAEDARTTHRAESYLLLLPEKDRPSRPVSEFWGILPENDLDPGVPGVIERFNAEKSWPGEKIAPPSEPYWVLAPGSAAESRRWPVQKFAALARQIAAESGLRGLIVGGRSEVSLAEELCQDPSLRLQDLTAQGPVSCYSRLFEKSRFTISNDSGLAHVAALCGSPVQVVWGAGDPKRTQPLGPGRSRILFNPVDCWPCERNICSREGQDRYKCLKGIQPEAVRDEEWTQAPVVEESCRKFPRWSRP